MTNIEKIKHLRYAYRRCFIFERQLFILFIFEYTSSTTKAYSLPHPYGIFHSYVMHTPQDQPDHGGYHILPEELPLHQNRNADTHRSHNPILILLQFRQEQMLRRSCKDRRNLLRKQIPCVRYIRDRIRRSPCQQKSSLLYLRQQNFRRVRLLHIQ